MTGFSANWLSLREPYDMAARNGAILAKVRAAFADRSAIFAIDLACGTGATARALAKSLPARQNWRLVDNDLGLLARAPALTQTADIAVAAMPVDLARDLEMALDGPLDLVATSAFLDLVSGRFVERLAVEAAARGLPVYAALSYDGRVGMTPEDDLDQKVVTAFNRHQKTDKGFGPALGPAAAQAAADLFGRVGYAVDKGTSDWRLGEGDQAIQLELLAGMAAAAGETGDIALTDLMAWLTRRRDAVAAGEAAMTVGHVDLFAVPTARRWGERSQSNSTSSPMA
ncbi:class I SAM-dependent methyltransferase [Xanthobacteraceae bacterium Astr-EGSB]|uniref:SAM-dependent methyltransferase n=1 Tax=Astrobacterium formosum TaxID=3069710 RepID=UPI0027AEF5E6|nr:class I SAM-dependent methyltransferase [Xanthobacteraceae bacterium Astr-EGSB]